MPVFMKVGMISLGCDKNRVDSEIMLGNLRKEGFEITSDPVKAEVIIINTCSFIEPAKEESINTILEMAEYKEKGNCRALIVTGCLSQRYREELLKEMPEVDGLLGTGELDHLPEVINSALQGMRISRVNSPGFDYDRDLPRVLTTPPFTSYLKIAEGCSHRCGFCIIPTLRGPYRSRSMDSILREARSLVEGGSRELILIAQDTSSYGIDLYGEPKLPDLLNRLAEIPRLHWLRILYTYPATFSEKLIAEMAVNPKVCHYVDLPLQHASDTVLERMGRGRVALVQKRLIHRLRAVIPDVAIRSTFIVGFPGETEAEFEELLSFLEEMRLDHVGVFTYSREEGTAAAAMEGQIPETVKEERRQRLMELQQKISAEKNRKRVGQEYEVLVEGPAEESDLVLTGRSQYQAPEVDGTIYIGNRWVESGQFVRVRIIEGYAYDLVAEVTGGPEEGGPSQQ